MKKLILSFILIAIAASVSAQAFKKGMFISIHTTNVTLQPGVTLDQYKEFYMTKVIPEYENLIPELKGYLVSAVRGEKKGSIGTMWTFSTEKEREKYFNDDGTPTEVGKANQQKMQPVFDELSKLGTSINTYTDWVVQ